MELTRQDLDVLIEAVEAWESKDLAGDMMESMLTSMMCKSEQDVEKHKSEFEKRQEKRESARRVRKERSVVLRAKLIGLRDSMDADRVLSDARS